MSTPRRSTIYLDAELHQALRLKAAATDRSVSELVNEAIRAALAEDEEDLRAFTERADEPLIAYEEALEYLKHDGKL